MAITSRKITTYAKNIADLPDRPNENGYTATTLKAFFDGRGDEEIKTNLNGLIDDLDAVLADISIKVVDSVDDTLQIQTAIDNASLGSGIVKLSKGETYYVGSLNPKENVTIDLNGSTLKLIDNTELPIFYDVGEAKSPKYKNFSVINGAIDANMQNNYSQNQSAGGFWLTDWDGLTFKNLKVTNAFRNIFNLYGCYNINIENVLCDTNGATNEGGFYSYGAAFETDCRNIVLRNFTVTNMYGYGVHFNNVENYVAENLIFDTLNYGTSSIAITATQSKQGKLNNIKCSGVTGDNIEINACTDLEITNVSISDAGDIPIIFGDNGTLASNERIKLCNVKTTSTGGENSINLNYLTNAEIKFCVFDKGLNTTAGNASTNVRLIDSEFGVVMPTLAVYYNRFYFTNVMFTDILIKRYDNNSAEFANLGVALAVADAEVVNIPLTKLDRQGGGLGGRLLVTSSFSDNYGQTTYQEHAIVTYGTTLNSEEILSVDGSYTRKIAVTMDGANKQIVLTNSTGVALKVKWSLALL